MGRLPVKEDASHAAIAAFGKGRLSGEGVAVPSAADLLLPTSG